MSKALIVNPASDIKAAHPGAANVLSRMVTDALVLARAHETTAAPVLTRIGSYEFCESDYQQILIWADNVKATPEVLINSLATVQGAFADGGSFLVENGSIKKVAFDAICNAAPDVIILSGLSEFDLSHVSALTELDCGASLVSDISDLTALLYGRCVGQLTKLDLSQVPLLTKLVCKDNHLTKLDLSNVPELNFLDCSGNPLTDLDLSRVPALTYLKCSGNQLTNLDLSQVPALTFLDCSENPLTEVDVSKNDRLVFLQFPPQDSTSQRPKLGTDAKTIVCDDHVSIVWNGLQLKKF